jgi:hypothetical protein
MVQILWKHESMDGLGALDTFPFMCSVGHVCAVDYLLRWLAFGDSCKIGEISEAHHRESKISVWQSHEHLVS